MIINKIKKLFLSALPSQKLDPSNGKIVGDKGVPIEKFPFQVSLQIFGLHYCGGVIISREWVLTNADCAEPHLKVRAGSNIPFSGGSMHQVDQYIIHENYTKEPLPRNDIALLRVSPLFEFDSTRQPIKLHDDEREIKDGAPATHSGFGIKQSGRFSKMLKAVTVQIVNRKNCSRDYEKIGFPGVSASTVVVLSNKKVKMQSIKIMVVFERKL